MTSTTLLERALFGAVTFDESEEYLAFRYRFLAAVMLTGAVITLVFVIAGELGANPMDNPHLRMMEVFSVGTFALWWFLRGYKERFRLVAWSYLLACELEYVSALVHVPEDELRVLWFFTNVSGVYLLLGRGPGLAVSLATGVGLLLGNPMLSRPYSPNAMATLVLGLVYMTLFFHLYASRSISYLKRVRVLNERLVQQATHDPLTGLLNARAYYELCDHWIASAQRSNAACSVLFIDLDHFKRINDGHGHAAGDTVLRTVASALAATVRRSDTVARIGGEEFSVFLPDTDTNNALVLAEKLRAVVEDLRIEVHGAPLRVTASVGVASARNAMENMASIQQRADMAMYQAKAGGRNRVSMLEAMPEKANGSAPCESFQSAGPEDAR